MAVPTRRLFFQWREEILAGKTVKDITEGSGKGYSPTTIRNYTKAERAKMKELERKYKSGEISLSEYTHHFQRRKRN